VTNQSHRSEPLREGRAGFSQAKLRVSYDDRQRLSWLLEFADLSSEKVAQLCASERTQLRFDLAFFAGLSNPPSQLPPLEEIAVFASEIRDGIERLLRMSRWIIQLPKNSGIVRTIASRDMSRAGRITLDGFKSFLSSDDFRTSLLLRAADVVEAEGTRIRVCAQKDCGRMFARHRRARYCSAPCSQKERDSRFRKRFTKSERSRRRHLYYKNRMARQFGRAVANRVISRPVKATPGKEK
jgi:hypothetical protein